MLEIARKLELAVIVRFVDYPTFLKYSGDLSDRALNPKPYEENNVNQVIVATPSDGRASLKDLLQANWKIVAPSPREDQIEVATPQPASAT